MNDLIELPDLKNIIGYHDMRTVQKWCRKNNIHIIMLGRKKYVHRQSIDSLVESQLSCCINTKDPSQSILDAVRKSKQPLLIQAIKPEVPTSKRKEIKGGKNVHSKAANQLLHALNSAK